jgi:23S rRNA pseudouridine2605 synthase
VAAIRLHKLLAEAGIASRRGAERLIRTGCVEVNGRPVTTPGAVADPERDRVTVEGQAIPRPDVKRYVLLHKPAGYLTTRHDPRGRRHVFDLLPASGSRLHPVGRLDCDTEGLLLLTNDGEVTYALTHPRHEVARVYHVWVDGPVDPAQLAALRRGVELEDGPARPEEVARLRREGSGTWLGLTLREGRNREVRRLCRATGLSVRRLVRVGFGPVRLGSLPSGAWRELLPGEVAALRALLARPPRPADHGSDAAGS